MKRSASVRAALVTSTCAYLGYAPVAPGTVGSAVGLVIWWWLRTGGAPVEAAVILGCALVGVWSAGVTERHLGTEDPGPVIIDEVVGMLVTLAFLPVSLWGAVAGFLLFRLFDIVKPFPADRAERLPAGWGIMADDVVAGIYAHIVLMLAIWVLAGLGA